jgi:protein O-GlcNAc transferase
MAKPAVQQILQQALQHHNAGRIPEAHALYEQVLALEPDQPDALHLLGLIALQTNRPAEGIELIRRALAVRPAFAQALSNLGSALVAAGRLDEAASSFDSAIALAPDNPEFHNNRGSALNHLARHEEALSSFRRAIAIKPEYAEAHVNLGCALNYLGRFDEAIASFNRAIGVRAGFAEAHLSLGSALRETGDLDGAVASFRRAVDLNPRHPSPHSNLGNALKDQGKLDEALAEYRTALNLRPTDKTAWSNWLMSIHYHPAFDAVAILNEHRRWNELCAEPLRALWRAHANDRAPERRLRIGYASPDFMDHPVGRFLIPLFESHDHGNFEIVCYSDVVAPDEVTDRLRRCTDEWHAVSMLGDAELAEKIRADRIDVLVDLALHAARNRLLAFARKPAPVQVTYLAYAGTSGLSAMDYRITDRYLDPPGNDGYYTERSARVESYWCYQPPAAAPPVAPAPVTSAGRITFGCLNNLAKVQPETMAVWAEILRSVDGSRLLLHARAGGHRARIVELFSSLGLEPDRIEFAGYAPTADYLRTYDQFDIALDPYPYNGGTTTCDALWMGVPVVTLAGKHAVARAGASLLSNVGLPELIASSPGEYVAIACGLAGDLPRLGQLRATLRDRMKASPLCDGPRLAKSMETIYRQAWRSWCSSPQS